MLFVASGLWSSLSRSTQTPHARPKARSLNAPALATDGEGSVTQEGVADILSPSRTSPTIPKP